MKKQTIAFLKALFVAVIIIFVISMLNIYFLLSAEIAAREQQLEEIQRIIEYVDKMEAERAKLHEEFRETAKELYGDDVFDSPSDTIVEGDH